jgi:hypothetical protein
MDFVGLGEKGRRSRIKADVEGLVFFENLIEDFSGFIDWPDQRQYFSRQVWMLFASFGVKLRTL